MPITYTVCDSGTCAKCKQLADNLLFVDVTAPHSRGICAACAIAHGNTVTVS